MIFPYFNLGNPVNPVYSSWSQTHKLVMKITYDALIQRKLSFWVIVIARRDDEAISTFGKGDCFALLAMTKASLLNLQ